MNYKERFKQIQKELLEIQYRIKVIQSDLGKYIHLYEELSKDTKIYLGPREKSIEVPEVLKVDFITRTSAYIHDTTALKIRSICRDMNNIIVPETVILKFNPKDISNRIELIKLIKEGLNIGLKDARDKVESGEIDVELKDKNGKINPNAKDFINKVENFVSELYVGNKCEIINI